MASVKCAECGLLALRTPGQEIRQAGHDARTNGRVPDGHGQMPVCIRGAASLDKEMAGATPDAFVQVVSKDRECDKFYTWHEGYSPKEHLDMVAQETLLKMQADQREADKRWQAEQRERDQRREDERREKDRKQEEERHKSDRQWQVRLIIAGGLFGVICGIIGFVANHLVGKLLP